MTAPAGKRDAAEQEAPQPRCIVWLAPERSAPRPLLHGLARRGVAAVLAHDAPNVMRELAEAPTRVVIVTEPAEQPRLEELGAAVRRYYPHTRLWQYKARGANGRPWLEMMDRPRDAQANGRANAPDVASASQHTLHKADDRQRGDAPPEPANEAVGNDDASRQPPPPLSSLTAEELAMLLGSDEPDDSPGASDRERNS